MYERITKKVVIDPYRGGDDTGIITPELTEKDFNLEISNYIYNRLKQLNIPASITRENDTTLNINDRIEKIKSFYGPGKDVIVISNALTTEEPGTRIVYALRNNNNLSQKIKNELEKTPQPFNRFYQRRLPSNTIKDYNQIIRDTEDNETIIIYYGNINNQNELNNLKNKKEELGEAVVIALADYLNVNYIPPQTENYYKVVSGDSLYSIAKRYNTTVDEIKNLNNLTSNTLSINQILKIPDQNNQTNYQTYKVVSGDSLYSIAKRYNTTVDEIKNLNNLTSNTLSINQILKIPDQNNQTNYQTYKVVSGDSLYSIAKRYNTTIDEIKKLNNLTSNTLSINQILKIPDQNNQTNYQTYKVVSGDSLYSIAKRYNTTIDEIKKLNNLISNTLSINQTLKIPS